MSTDSDVGVGLPEADGSAIEPEAGAEQEETLRPPQAEPEQQYKIPEETEAKSETVPSQDGAQEPKSHEPTEEDAQPATWTERLKDAARNPMAMPTLGLLGVLIVFGALRSNADSQSTAIPEPVSNAHHSTNFPETDFRASEKGAVTDRKVHDLLTPHRKGKKPIEASKTDRERLYTAAEMAAAVEAAKKEQPSATIAKERPPRPQRRKARGGGRQRRAVPELIPALFQPGGIVQDDTQRNEGGGRPRLRLPVGARIPAILDVGVSSARHGAVIARTSAEMVTTDGRKIAVGTVITGKSSSGHDRIYADFRKVIIEGEAFAIRAVATAGKQLGLPATETGVPLEDRTGARAGQGALGALRGAVSAIGGPLASGLSGAAGGVMDEAQRELQVDRTVVLAVPAGMAFELVVVE
jgi:hypothetical protein